MSDHFSSPLWVDRVRGLLPEDVREEMDQHLSTGCDECRAAFQTWSDFGAFAADEAGVEPPREAVRVAKTYLAQRALLDGHAGLDGRTGSARRRAWAPSLLATLVFDSMQTAGAGVRSAAGYSRHLLFAAQSLAIDLHVETAAKPGWFLLAGQIADSSRPDQMPRKIDLCLVDGDRELSAFQTNDFGEFQCTFDRRKDLTLLLGLDSGAIALPLEVLFTPSTPSNPSTAS
jgi:hypothetical protein